MSNVIPFLPAAEDWRPITEMDRVLVRAHETLQRFAGEVHDEEDLALLLAAMEEIARAFNAAWAKGSRLTP
jgi:hypothetical protein